MVLTRVGHIALHMRIMTLAGSHMSSWWRTRAKSSYFKCAIAKGGSGLNSSVWKSCSYMFVSWVNHADIYIQEKCQFAVFRKNSIKRCSVSIKLLKFSVQEGKIWPKTPNVMNSGSGVTVYSRRAEAIKLYLWIPEPRFIRLHSWWQTAEDRWWGRISVKTSFCPHSNPAVNLISWCRVKGHAGYTAKAKESFDNPNLHSLCGLLAYPANT